MDRDMMRNRFIVCTVALLALVPLTVRADLVGVEIDFTINSTYGGFPGPESFETDFVFDTSEIMFSDSTQVSYGLHSTSVRFNGATFNGDGTGGRLTYHDQVPFTPPRDRIGGFANYDAPLDGILITAIGFAMEGPETIFDISEVPFIPDITDFSEVRPSIAFTDGDDVFSVGGESDTVISRLSISEVNRIPEPGGLGLMAIAMFVMWITCRRREVDSARD